MPTSARHRETRRAREMTERPRQKPVATVVVVDAGAVVVADVVGSRNWTSVDEGIQIVVAWAAFENMALASLDHFRVAERERGR